MTKIFHEVEINKKEFHASMQPTVLSPVNISEIVAQAKFKQNDKIFNNFIGLRLKEITKGNYI